MGIDAMWRWGWCGLAALGAACAVADDGEQPRAVEVGSMLIDGMTIAGA